MVIKKAIIPAAGTGTRMIPLTLAVPKELLTVNNTPLIDYSLAECLAAKVERIYIIINKKKEGIRHYLDHRYAGEMQFEYIYQDKPTGILDAVLLAEPYIENALFFILFPDVIYHGNDNSLIELEKTYRSNEKPCVALVETADEMGFAGNHYGQVEYEKKGEVYKITRLHDKGSRSPNQYKATGRALWNSEVLGYLKKYRIKDDRGGCSEVPALQKFTEEMDYYGVLLSGVEYDCGNLQGWRRATHELKGPAIFTENYTMEIELSVVIPVYNEEEVLPELHHKLLPAIEKITDKFEILLVDDGSRDKSFDIIESFADQDPRIKGIRFARNFGQHAAITAGLKRSKGRIVVTMDADLQNPPEEIPKLIDGLKDGFDLVWGRFQGRQHNPFRKFGSFFAKYVLKNIMGGMNTNISTFRAIDRGLVKRLGQLNENSRFIDGLFIWLGAKAKVVDVKHNPRRQGKTKYNLFNLIRLWFDMVTSFSDFPLKLATVTGIGFGLLGALAALFYLFRKMLFGFDVPGFATIIIAILLFSGIQLFCLGMLGEYIARIFLQTKDRPVFIVDKESGFDGQ